MFLSWAKGLGFVAVVGVFVLAGGCQHVEGRASYSPEGSGVVELEGAESSEGVVSEGATSGEIVSEGATSEATASERTASPPGLGAAAGSLAERIWSLPGVVIEDSKEIVRSEGNLFWLLAAAGGSIALRQSGADDRIDDSFRDNPWISSNKGWDEFVYQVGGPGVHFAASGIWYLSAAAKGDPVGTRNAWTMLEALSVTGAATLALKLIINDETPNGKNLAWPSGHTSSSFTVAAVLDELYGPAVGIPAYLGAGFVGYRMMDARDHWASDVLFGAVLGYIVGHHVAQKYHSPEVAGFRLVPYNDVVADRYVTGVGFVKAF